MKKISICLFILCITTSLVAQEKSSQDPFEVLKGKWKLDLSPENPDDDNFTELSIKDISPLGVKGEFYYTKMREGRVNISFEGVYFAFVTNDGSGDYNSVGIFKDGKLSGSTHSLGRDFLSVWTGEKIE